jgi:hypothetical protein
VYIMLYAFCVKTKFCNTTLFQYMFNWPVVGQLRKVPEEEDRVMSSPGFFFFFFETHHNKQQIDALHSRLMRYRKREQGDLRWSSGL